MSKVSSKMDFLNDAVFVENESEMCSLAESFEGTDNKPGNPFQVHVSNDQEGSSSFTIADLKHIVDIEAAILMRYPENYLEKLSIHYRDGNGDDIPIDSSDDFVRFLQTHHDQNIFVSWTKKTPVNKRSSKKESADDLILWALVSFGIFFFIVTVLEFGGHFLQDPNSADRLDRRNVIQDFCRDHSSEECQTVVSNFLSFMAFKSLANK